MCVCVCVCVCECVSVSVSVLDKGMERKVVHECMHGRERPYLVDCEKHQLEIVHHCCRIHLSTQKSIDGLKDAIQDGYENKFIFILGATHKELPFIADVFIMVRRKGEGRRKREKGGVRVEGWRLRYKV